MKIRELKTIEYEIGNVILSDVQRTELMEGILHGISLGEIIDEAVDTYRNNLKERLEIKLEVTNLDIL